MKLGFEKNLRINNNVAETLFVAQRERLSIIQFTKWDCGYLRG